MKNTEVIGNSSDPTPVMGSHVVPPLIVCKIVWANPAVHPSVEEIFWFMLESMESTEKIILMGQK